MAENCCEYVDGNEFLIETTSRWIKLSLFIRIRYKLMSS